VDSSLIAALIQREAGTASTFTVGFEDMPSEAPAAARTARILGTRHTELMMSGADALAAVPRMATIYDEPLGDSSAIPTYLVAALARQHVTVALSGDGGDELFGGYHRYFLGQRSRGRVERVPRALRRPIGAALKGASHVTASRGLRARLRGLGASLVNDDPMTDFAQSVEQDLLDVIGASRREFVMTNHHGWPRLREATDLMMYLDAKTYMTDDILAKVDRASMAVSLEVREPLLDHRLVELAWSLPLHMKTRNLRGKWILRRLLSRYLPPELVEREKHGFGLPIEEWLRGPLREWAAALVDPQRIARDGMFEPASVRKVWNGGPVEGAENVLWRLLMFQQWMGEDKL
jgi:asparagine synthase (glutamine-hydrolysing)